MKALCQMSSKPGQPRNLQRVERAPNQETLAGDVNRYQSITVVTTRGVTRVPMGLTGVHAFVIARAKDVSPDTTFKSCMVKRGLICGSGRKEKQVQVEQPIQCCIVEH